MPIYLANEASASILGYAAITAQLDGVVSAAEQAVPGLSVTVTVPAGRTIRVSGYVHLRSSVATDTTYARILEDGAQREFSFGNEIAAPPHSPLVESILTPSAGTHTYSIAITRQVGTGFPRAYAAAAEPSYIIVEDITGSTWPAGSAVTAGIIASEIWTSFTPTLTQNNAAVAKTVNYAKYYKMGRRVDFRIKMTLTATGTASTTVKVGLPPFACAETADYYMGQGYLYDQSAAALYRCFPTPASSSAEVFLSPANSTVADVLGATTFTAALASGDIIVVAGTYEATS